MPTKTFTLTSEHIKLLRSTNVGWDDCEYGAPAIDCKRPYGNSGALQIAQDIHELLKWPFPAGEGAREDHFDGEGGARARKIHEELETALQIVLVVGAFEVGVYEREREYDSTSWRKVR